MAQLFRMVKQNDSAGTQTFTFILPSAATKGNQPEILSRDFLFGYQKWRLSFQKRDPHLSPYLRLVSVSEGSRVWVDYNIVLINRDTFSKNEMFGEKQAEFNALKDSHGQRTFVTMNELPGRHFTDFKGEYLFELTLRNIRSSYEEEILLAPVRYDNKNRQILDYQRYDTGRFFFGELEWTAVFCPNMDFIDDKSRHMIQISRVSKCDSSCKLRYSIVIGLGSKALNTGILEEIFDCNGNGEGFYFTDDYFQFTQSNTLYVRFELHSINFINQLKLSILNDAKSRVTFSDKDRQSWCLSGCAKEEKLFFSLFYSDVGNIPANYLRYVMWSLTLVAYRPVVIVSNPQNKPSTEVAIGAPFERYFVSTVRVDNGFRMDTRLPVAELNDPKYKWLDEDQKLTVCLEWQESYLLINPNYHVYDDVLKRHLLQMRREIQALQSENGQLEKELHNYQQSIATKCAHDTAGHSSPAADYPLRRASFNCGESRNTGDRCSITSQVELVGVATHSIESKSRDRTVRSPLPSQPSKDSGIMPDVHSLDSASASSDVVNSYAPLERLTHARCSTAPSATGRNRRESNETLTVVRKPDSRPTTPKTKDRPERKDSASRNRNHYRIPSEPYYPEEERQNRSDSICSNSSAPASSGVRPRAQSNESYQIVSRVFSAPKTVDSFNHFSSEHSVLLRDSAGVRHFGERCTQVIPLRRQVVSSFYHRDSERERDHRLSTGSLPPTQNQSPLNMRRKSNAAVLLDDGYDSYADSRTRMDVVRVSPHSNCYSPQPPRKHSYDIDERMSSRPVRRLPF